MPKTGLKPNWKLVLLTAVFLISLLITAAPRLNLPFHVPSWPEIFKEAGLRSETPVSGLPFNIHFINVGQGDCIVAKTEGGCVLIDAGDTGNADDIIRYLRNIGVDTIDYAVVTHTDTDHIGSMPEVLDAFKVINVILPPITKENVPTTKVFENLMNAVARTKATVIKASPGQKFGFGEAGLELLGPYTVSRESNNNSVVAGITFGNNTFLLMGDAEYEEETDLLEHGFIRECDVLKVAHHGSNSSTSQKLLEAARPEIAVISVGKDNFYNHPDLIILNRLKEADIEVYRTDLCGNIVIGSDGKDLTVYYENSEV